jgi:hypothetical protein
VSHTCTVVVASATYFKLQLFILLFIFSNKAVIQTLEKLGGVATLGQLNQEVLKIKEFVLIIVADV